MPFARQHREEIKRLASGGGWYGETVSETMKLLPVNRSSWGGSATEQKKKLYNHSYITNVNSLLDVHIKNDLQHFHKAQDLKIVDNVIKIYFA